MNKAEALKAALEGKVLVSQQGGELSWERDSFQLRTLGGLICRPVVISSLDMDHWEEKRTPVEHTLTIWVDCPPSQDNDDTLDLECLLIGNACWSLYPSEIYTIPVEITVKEVKT